MPTDNAFWKSRNRSPDPYRWLSLQFFDSMALCKPQPLFSILTLSCSSLDEPDAH
jgi:hypothetical protein